MESILVKEYQVTNKDPFIMDHRVNDVPIMPGIVFFNFIAQAMNSCNMDMSDIIFKDVVFMAPIVPENELLTTIQIIIDNINQTISARSYDNNKNSIIDHYFCNYETKNNNKTTSLDFNKESKLVGDLGRCYDVTRNVGITHHASMKRFGDLYEGDEQLLVNLQSGNNGQSNAFVDCKLDPSLLDCATVAPMYYFNGDSSDKILYVPFSIDSVWIDPVKFNTSKSIITHKPENINKKSETFSFASHLFDDKQTRCASIVGFKVKKVHNIDSFTRLNLKNNTRISKNNSASDTQLLKNKYEHYLTEIVEKLTGNIADIEADFFDVGLDSADLLDIASKIENSFSIKLYPTVMFEYNNIRKMANYLTELKGEYIPEKTKGRTTEGKIKDILFSYTASDFGVDDEFLSAGLDSSDLLEISTDLENAFKTRIYPSLLFEHTTIRALSKYIESHVTTNENITDTVNLTAERTNLYVNKKTIKQSGETRDYGGLTEQKNLIWESGNVANITGILKEIFGNPTLFDRNINIESLASFENLIFVTTGLLEKDGDIKDIFERLKTAGENFSKLKIRSVIFIYVSDSHTDSDKTSTVGAYGTSALFKVFAKENNLSYTQVFITGKDHMTGNGLLNLLAEAKDREVVIDNGVMIENTLASITLDNHKASIFQQGGVYIILGGTGGIGQYLAKYLINHHNARIIIVGRNLDKLSSDALFNTETIDTYQADISKLPEIEGMLEYCSYKYNSINGIFHSAMLLEDSLISKMSYEAFNSPLLPKYVGAKNLITSTKKYDLDFICFFSSIQSYICNYGQANYASASRYMDEYLRIARATRQNPIFTVNWGYWSDIGAVSSQRYNDIMKRSGIIPVDKDTSLMAMEQAMSNYIDEFAIFNGDKNVLDACNVVEGKAFLASDKSTRYDLTKITKHAASKDVKRLGPLFSKLDNIALGYLNTLNKKYKEEYSELLFNSNNIIPSYKPLANELNILLENSSELTNIYEAQNLKDDLTLLTDEHPVLTHFCNFLYECLINTEAVLTGKTEASNLFFSSDVFNILSYIYANNPVSDYYNNIVADTVRALADNSKSIKIIELGAGTGSTTDRVLSILNQSGINYNYTFSDIGEKFIANAKDKYKGNPDIECIFYDVSSAISDQYLSRFDIIIATNVIHATKNITTTLNNVKSLLKKGGAFILNENIKKNNFSTFTFGLLHGWWSHNDKHIRIKASPLLSEEKWNTLLRLNGFDIVKTCVERDSDNEQQVFVSLSNGIYEKQPTVASSNNENFISNLSLNQKNINRYNFIKHYTDTNNNNWIILDNGKGNILTIEMVKELIDAFQRIEGQNKIIYLSHSQGAFSLGGDRAYIADIINNNNYKDLEEYADLSKKLINIVSKCDSIVIAIVNGSAQGGGLETLLCTDYQFVSSTVKLGFPEVKSGLIPGMGGMTYLTHQIGINRAKQLLLNGGLIPAKKAQRWGMISHVSDDPYTAATLFSRQLTHLPTAIWMKKFVTSNVVDDLTLDIDVWLNYIKKNNSLIDVNYIQKTKLIINREGKENHERK